MLASSVIRSMAAKQRKTAVVAATAAAAMSSSSSSSAAGSRALVTSLRLRPAPSLRPSFSRFPASSLSSVRSFSTAEAEAMAAEKGSSGALSSFITAALIGCTAFAGYKLFNVYFMWPEGCEAIMQQVKQFDELKEAFGEPMKAGFGWDGEIRPDGVSVHIPVSGPKGEGMVFGRAVQTNGEWKVVMCEVRVDHTESSNPSVSPTNEVTTTVPGSDAARAHAKQASLQEQQQHQRQQQHHMQQQQHHTEQPAQEKQQQQQQTAPQNPIAVRHAAPADVPSKKVT